MQVMQLNWIRFNRGDNVMPTVGHFPVSRVKETDDDLQA